MSGLYVASSDAERRHVGGKWAKNVDGYREKEKEGKEGRDGESSEEEQLLELISSRFECVRREVEGSIRAL